jgi:chorismate synthase
VVIDGLPAGLDINREYIQACLNKRRPGQSSISTPRSEKDEFEIISGVFENKSTGHPISILIPNQNQNSKDYENLKDVYRPSHADFTYQEKYGIRDYRGGGRASARVTAAWVAAGAIAQLLLRSVSSTEIHSYVSQVHTVALQDSDHIDTSTIENTPVRCPNEAVAQKMIEAIDAAKQEGDSLGGIIHTEIVGCPRGLGEPVFSKLHADLGQAILSINACKGIQFGKGFESVMMKGSEFNDELTNKSGKIETKSNHSGGIQGGISNGSIICFDAAFRPTSSISKTQNTVNHDGKEIELQIDGRHDPCVVPRAVPIVEAMTALVLADHLLIARLSKIEDLI